MSASRRPSFRYLGHSTIECTMPSGEVMLIDPWVGQNPACPEDCKELERIDAMLITHAHFDHIGDAVELAKKHKPKKVVACYEICAWLEAQGVENCSGMNLGGSQEVLGARVSMVRADHSSGLPGGDLPIYGAVAAGFVVRLDEGYSFYHAGDTALFSDMELISELFRPELAFLPIGDLFTMDPHQASIACRLLAVRAVVPIHWGTFPALTGTPQKLEELLIDSGTNTTVVTLQPGDTY